MIEFVKTKLGSARCKKEYDFRVDRDVILVIIRRRKNSSPPIPVFTSDILLTSNLKLLEIIKIKSGETFQFSRALMSEGEHRSQRTKRGVGGEGRFRTLGRGRGIDSQVYRHLTYFR